MSTMRNNVMLIGYPSQPVMDSENKKATFKLTVKDDSKNGCQKVNVFDCAGYGNVAQRIVSQVNGSREIAIDGSLRNYDYQDRMGDTHTHTEIVVNDLFIIRKKD